MPTFIEYIVVLCYVIFGSIRITGIDMYNAPAIILLIAYFMCMYVYYELLPG